jgi:hypothetical protein
MDQDSLVSIVIWLQAGQQRFGTWQGQEIFLFSIAFRPALGPTQTPLPRVLGALSQGVKWLGHEADQTPPSSAVVKNDGAIPPLSHMPSWHSA